MIQVALTLSGDDRLFHFVVYYGEFKYSSGGGVG